MPEGAGVKWCGDCPRRIGLIFGCAKKEKDEVDMDDVDSRPTGAMPRLSDLAFNAVYRDKPYLTDDFVCIILYFSVWFRVC